MCDVRVVVSLCVCVVVSLCVCLGLVCEALDNRDHFLACVMVIRHLCVYVCMCVCMCDSVTVRMCGRVTVCVVTVCMCGRACVCVLVWCARLLTTEIISLHV